MADYKYCMELSWSERDRLWIVLVPQLPGCFVDGETPAQAVENAQEVFRLWIETAHDYGITIPPLQRSDVSTGA